MTYHVKHLDTGSSFERPSILYNQVSSLQQWAHQADPEVEGFHRTLPQYGETRLYSLPDVAAELGLGYVFIKDEGTRFSLPSFKILGASWAIHKALCRRLEIPGTISHDALAKALDGHDDIRLVTCTEGNWGRAVARMAKYLSIPCRIYVPWFMNEYTQDLLRSEGADVQLLSDGSYDDTIAAVKAEAATTNSLMVLDTSFEDYTEFPQWVTDGYSTMLTETDRQVAAKTAGKAPNIALVSVGVGSWAHSVVSHYRSKSTSNQVISVEPIAAASFKESLHCRQITPIETGETIMRPPRDRLRVYSINSAADMILDGMNCGTTSTIAWPILRDGISAAVTVLDTEAHEAVQYLESMQIEAGPCGAATLAALRKLCEAKPGAFTSDAVVVLFSTEGKREYEIPQ